MGLIEALKPPYTTNKLNLALISIASRLGMPSNEKQVFDPGSNFQTEPDPASGQIIAHLIAPFAQKAETDNRIGFLEQLRSELLTSARFSIPQDIFHDTNFLPLEFPYDDLNTSNPILSINDLAPWYRNIARNGPCSPTSSIYSDLGELNQILQRNIFLAQLASSPNKDKILVFRYADSDLPKETYGGKKIDRDKFNIPNSKGKVLSWWHVLTGDHNIFTSSEFRGNEPRVLYVKTLSELLTEGHIAPDLYLDNAIVLVQE